MLFIFGESEKGAFCRPTFCKQLVDLMRLFGHPPEMSQGLFFATQTLLLEKPCLFFRVEEEGYSVKDYLKGLDILKRDFEHLNIHAIGLPGVGSQSLIEKTERCLNKQRSLILLNDQDLFDYLTS
jgi:hypothetical protein